MLLRLNIIYLNIQNQLSVLVPASSPSKYFVFLLTFLVTPISSTELIEPGI